VKTERYFKLILKKWWIIALLEIIALGATFYFVTTQAETYTSTATLILNPKNTNSIIPYTNSGDSSADSLAENYNLVLKSENFLSQVMGQLGFPISTEDLKKAFTSKLTPGTLFYYISATSTSPEKAQKIAGTVTQFFLANQTDNNKAAEQTNAATTLQTQKDELTALNADIADLTQQIKDLQAQPNTPDNLTKLNSLNSQRRDLLDTQGRTVLAISELEKTAANSDTNYAYLLNEAKLPARPDASNLLRNLVFAFALALALGIGVILLLDYLDTSVQSGDDLVGLTGKAALAQIPEIKFAQPKEGLKSKTKEGLKSKTREEAPETTRKLALPPPENKLSDLLVTSGPDYSPAAEAYRSLRTNMLFSNQASKPEKLPGSPAKSFLVASALSGEGRSLTAANLAIAFAQTGKKVILIDSDLRHPSQHILFNLPNEIGFSDLALLGITKLTRAVHSTSIQNLVVVSAGSTLSNPSELLTSTKASNVIKFFKNIADIVIFDSPPVSLVTDAAILATLVDQVVLVVEHTVTPRSMVASTILELNKVGAHLEGIVLNRVKSNEVKKFNKYFNYQPPQPKKTVRESPGDSTTTEDSLTKDRIIQPETL
jgi:capsular exopolysaccharide synthesis family protein